MAPKTKFQEGEKVLCYHGPVIYEAKCLRTTVKNKEVLYQVHYSGWNKNWDEWVPDSRMIKYNEAGLQKQKELKAAHGKSKKKNKISIPTPKPTAESKVPTSETKADKEIISRSSTPSNEKPSTKHKLSESVTSGESSRRKRAKVEPAVETEEQYTSKAEVKIKLPDGLKPCLVDDWDMINRQKMLVLLPAKKSIDKILDEYYQARVAKDKEARDTVLEITKGIRDYFNTMLGTQLLYKFERSQYGDILKENPEVQLTAVYGSVHLLRLFVKLGNMLAFTNLDEKAISVLLSHLQDFLRWLNKNAGNLFHSSDYFSAPPDYHRKAFTN